MKQLKGKLSERMRLILALLKVYGPQPIENLKRIVYPGQTEYLSKQHQYLLRTLNHLEEEGLIENRGKLLWQITKRE